MATKSEPPGAASGESSDAEPDDDVVSRTELSEFLSSATATTPTPIDVQRPPPWEEQFLEIVNNSAKLGGGRTKGGDPSGPVRDHGFLVVTHGSASLQRVQALCHQSDQRYNTFLTARYTVSQPVLGNLLAALVNDLARLAQTPGTTPPVGDLRPPTTGLSTPPWLTLRSGPFPELAAFARLDKDNGELSADWVTQLFRSLGSLLPTGVRLVLFAEVEGESRPEDWQRIVAATADLPERVGIVVDGGRGGVPIPRERAWDRNVAGPTGSCLELQVESVPRTRAIKFVDAPLSGDAPAGTDAFDLSRYAAGLAKLVLLPGTGPLTIGVHAPWGRGKTSFMYFIERELIRHAAANQRPPDRLQKLAGAEAALADLTRPADEREKAQQTFDAELAKLRRHAGGDVIPVWFNAWRYDGATQIWAGLTHEITERLEQALPWHRRIWARIVYAVQNHGAAFWIGSFAPAVSALLLTILVLGLGLGSDRTEIGDQLPDWLRWLLPVAPSASLLALGGYLTWRFTRVVRPVSERLLDYVRQPDYRQHMGYQHQVLRDIQFLTSRLGPDKHRPRVVVFIDDLDRCSDDKVLETLQAINLLLTASGCYVFLGIDTYMIAQAVTRKYELATTDTARAESYLRKIIQLSFRLPAPEQDQRLGLLARLFSHQARLDYETLVGRSFASNRSQPPPRAARPVVRGSAPPGIYSWSAQGVRKPEVFDIADVEDTVDELDAFARLRHVLPDNPRELKRLANLHRLVKILIQRADAPPTAVAQRLLVAWLIFCFVYGGAARELLRRARSDEGATEMHRSELDALIDRLNRDHAGEQVPALTAAQLSAGSALAEAAAISGYFQEQPDMS